ncbi:rubrerythrin family protein [Halorientalis halophila]|uniref:rubrerythrin family protein n=1 Tax=Halorientalis halophila TaxID=3108499 RepID=UPI00300A7E26
MNPEDFLDGVRQEQQTELSRLGSSKSLYADTGGEMEEGPVLTAIADTFHHAASTFESWTDEADGAAGDLFASVADLAGEQYGTVAGELGDHEAGAPAPLTEFLQGLDTEPERVGGVVGWALVVENKVSQAVGFFVGQAAPQTASTFRDVRDAVESVVDDAADAVAAVCDSEDDADLAHEAAVGAVQAAYDDYFDTLEDLGVNPKPVC